MNEAIYRGDEIEYIITKEETIDDYNSIRWFVNGNEVNAKDIEIVIYISEEGE